MSHRNFSAVLLIILCFFSIAGNADAADKTVIIPLGANNFFKGDQYLTLSNAAFSPNRNTTNYVRPLFIHADGYLELQETLVGFFASVNLPDGAAISQISTYAEKTGNPCDMIFTKHALSDHQATSISLSETENYLAPAEYGPMHTDIANEVIDNQNFQYILTWACSGFGGPCDRLYATRLKYRLQ